MSVHKFVADSYHEAHLKARMELGDNIIVLQTKTYPQKFLGGIYSKEVVELTVAAAKSNEPPVVAAPLKPVQSEEIIRSTKPQQVNSSKTAVKNYTTALGNSGNVSPSTFLSRDRTNGNARELRTVHTLRSNQEGSIEPQSQRVVDEDEQTAKTLEVLGSILKKRAQMRPEPSTSAAAHCEVVAKNETLDKLSYQHLERRLNEIATIVRDMKTSADNIIAKPTPSLPSGLFCLKKRLQNQEFPSEVIDEMLSHFEKEVSPADIHNEQRALSGLANWFIKVLHFTPNPQPSKSGPQIFALVGPTGVGKTTTIAKLAANYALNMSNRKSVALFTMDTYRIGGTHQMEQYAKIIDATMEILYEPDDVLPALKKHQDKDVILIDTAGRCPKNADELAALRNFIKFFGAIRTYLVLSATTKYSDMLEIVRRFRHVGFDELIFTKVDETDTIGPLLSLLYKTSLPLAYLTDGQSVPNDFKPADIEYFLSRFTC